MLNLTAHVSPARSHVSLDRCRHPASGGRGSVVPCGAARQHPAGGDRGAAAAAAHPAARRAAARAGRRAGRRRGQPRVPRCAAAQHTGRGACLCDGVFLRACVRLFGEMVGANGAVTEACCETWGVGDGMGQRVSGRIWQFCTERCCMQGSCWCSISNKTSVTRGTPNQLLPCECYLRTLRWLYTVVFPPQVLQQQSREQARLAANTATPDPGVQDSPATVIASLPASVRQQVCPTCCNHNLRRCNTTRYPGGLGETTDVGVRD